MTKSTSKATPKELPPKNYKPNATPVSPSGGGKRNQINPDLLSEIMQATGRNETDLKSLTDVINEHRRRNVLKGLSEHTVIFYAKESKAFYRALIDLNVDTSDITKITTEHIEDFLAYLFEKKFANTTINSRLRAVKTLFEFAVQSKYIKINPATAIPNVKVRHQVGEMFSPKQLKLILDQPNVSTVTGLRDFVIMLTFAHTGIRLSELGDLTVQNVYFDGNYLMVERTKNGIVRRIPMTKRLRTSMAAWLQVRATIAVDTDTLFLTENGTPLSVRQIQYHVKYYGKQAGISDAVRCSPHVFRRTFAKEKIRAGVDVFTVQALMGHSDLSVLKRYVQIFSSDLDDSIERGIE